MTKEQYDYDLLLKSLGKDFMKEHNKRISRQAKKDLWYDVEIFIPNSAKKVIKKTHLGK